MKKLTLLLLMFSASVFAQFTTGTVSLAGSTRTLKIDTNTTTVTMTLTGSSTAWLGVGFGGGSMASVSDFFIWNATANRDYTPTNPTLNAGHNTPTADSAVDQSWNIFSDNITGTTRTVVATRALVSTGDYTFLNDNSSIPIIFAEGSTVNFGYHSSNPHSAQTLTRSALGVEDFSLKASSIYPNPSNGTFRIQTKTDLTKVNVYGQTGNFIKTIEVKDNSQDVEVNLKGVAKGIYLLELQNEADKSWKKIVVE
jgi:Secretion system C-terminal sorting domain